MKDKQIQKEKLEAVSIVIPMRNASTTVLETLKTVVKQKHPINEIIVVDNVSKDNSKELVLEYAKKCKIPIRLLIQKKDGGISVSLNRGSKNAVSSLVVFLASDISLLSTMELSKLISPIQNKLDVVAAYSITILPRYIWKTYNFWQKLHSVRYIGQEIPSMDLKFDCVRKKNFLKIGGFDEVRFGGDDSIGGEDTELPQRLGKEGKMLATNARAIHIHYIGNDYSLLDMAKSRKMYARSCARFIRKNFFLQPIPSLTFLIRPSIAILPFLPYFHFVGVGLVAGYSLLYSWRMFATKETLLNPRILLVPLINVFFLYYEIAWMIEAFFTYKKVV